MKFSRSCSNKLRVNDVGSRLGQGPEALGARNINHLNILDGFEMPAMSSKNLVKLSGSLLMLTLL